MSLYDITVCPPPSSWSVFIPLTFLQSLAGPLTGHRLCSAPTLWADCRLQHQPFPDSNTPADYRLQHQPFPDSYTPADYIYVCTIHLKKLTYQQIRDNSNIYLQLEIRDYSIVLLYYLVHQYLRYNRKQIFRLYERKIKFSYSRKRNVI